MGLRQHIKKAYVHVRPKANTITDYRVLLTIALQSLNEQAPQGVTISRRQLYFGLAANIPWSFHTKQDSLELWTEDYIKQLKGLDTLYKKRILLAQKRANMARQNNLIYKPNQLVLFSEITKQTDAILTPHIVLKITSPRCKECVRDVDQCRGCENKPSTAIQIQCLNTGKKKVTDKSNLYPLLGSDYISPKLLQYVTQLHSRAKQESTTQQLDDDVTSPNQLTQADDQDTNLSNTEQTATPDITLEKQQTQDIPTVDTEILSPDPTREILLKYTPNKASPQTNNPNTQTPIREEWIIQDEILPDNQWKTQSQNTRTQHNVNIAQQTQSILKKTPPVNFQFIDRHQSRAYTKATHLANTLGSNSPHKLKPIKSISTKKHMRYFQQLNPSKASHNRKVHFDILEHTNNNSKRKSIITEEDLIFSVLNCISLQESHLRSENSTLIL